MPTQTQTLERPSAYPVDGVFPHQPPGYSMTYPPPTMVGSIHTVHAILSLLTLGLWIPVWIIDTIRSRRQAKEL